jgi:hypothetical protein
MIVLMMLGLGNFKLTLAEPSDHDFDMSKGILKGIDCEIDVMVLHDPLIDFASMSN